MYQKVLTVGYLNWIFRTVDRLYKKVSNEKMVNERRSYFRIEDDVLLRYQAIDKSTALANQIPQQYIDDPSYSLMHEIQKIDQEYSPHLHSIAEHNRDLEIYLKSINKKIYAIAAHFADTIKPVTDQLPNTITLSEGGLSFRSHVEHAHDGYLAIQVSFLSLHQTIVLFCKIINCSPIPGNGYNVAVSFVQLSDYDRQVIAKHIMQVQLARKREELQK